ncbi:hypothetical protein EXIGLDRAFT_843528 [Exidia glandulosa HHB12029]|uniref:Uncharacterized protein n=1 Tax=Exidia glandulosa HHB12029 TaxID=1314781 RepID=A0A165CKU6_EXIGL|nr:hypothetical protein EXIGLDRAFT_843528 [Exidia glandulosa HHB12029]
MVNLAREEWDLIFEEVYASPSSRVRTLRAVCLVSKSMYQMAMPWLYRHVRIVRGPPRVSKGCDSFYTIYKNPAKFAASVYVLVLLCPWGSAYYSSVDPWVRNWISALTMCRELREVEIRPMSGYPCTLSEFEATLSYILSAMQQLKKLRIVTLDLFPPRFNFAARDPNFDVTFDLPSVALPGLRSFGLSVIDPSRHEDLIRRVNDLLRVAPKMRTFRLTLDFTQLHHVLSPQCRELLTSVTNLRILPTSCCIPAEIFSLPRRLTELTLRYNAVYLGVHAAVQPVTTLRVLTIEAPNPRTSGTHLRHEFDAMLVFIASLTQGSQLEHLTIESMCPSDDSGICIDQHNFNAAALPTTLNGFYAEKISVSTPVIVQLSRNCPGLRGLAVQLRYTAEFAKFPLQALSETALQCVQLSSWYYGDACDVQMGQQSAVQWLERSSRLKHITVNRSTWLATRGSQLRAVSLDGTPRYPVDSVQKLDAWRHDACALTVR